MQTRIRIITILLIIIIVYGISYYLTYLRYNDKSNVELNALEIEINYLKTELNDLKTYYELAIDKDNYFIAKVVNRDLYNFYNELTIKSNNSKLEDGMPVLSDEGLIGITSNTSNGHSIVKLLTQNYNISVKINDTYGNLNNGIITLLKKDANINVGDKVYTSGLTNIKPGIYIGEITDIDLNKDQTSKKAQVKLLDNSNINYVAIMVNS